jgi:LysM repeat protein
MKPLSSVIFTVLSVMLLALVVVAAPAQSAPLQQDNLLRNGDFEAAPWLFNGEAQRQIPAEWEPWWDNAKAAPFYNPAEAPFRLQSGIRAASYWAQSVDYDAGLRQIVPGLTPGTVLRFQAYGQAWSTTDTGKSTSDTDVSMRIGIDPNGQTNPFESGVVWSGTASARDTYQLFTVEATVSGTQVVVFLRGSTIYPVAQTDFYWDNASLVAIAQAQPTAGPTATEKPKSGGGGSSGVPAGSIPKSTPAPDGSVVHIVRSGETLIGIAVTYGVSLDDIRKLNNLKGDTIYVGQSLVIKTASASAPEPTEEESAGEGATEEPTGEPTEEVAEAGGSSTICVMSYEDGNGNGIREPEELKLGGITFMLSDGINTVGTYTTDGINEPYCFTDLTPGAYVVSWVADTFLPTTDQTWAASVGPGATVSREFGAKSAGAAGAEEPTEEKQPSGKLPTWLIAVGAAFGAIIFLSGLGAAAYFLIIRRSATID